MEWINVSFDDVISTRLVYNEMQPEWNKGVNNNSQTVQLKIMYGPINKYLYTEQMYDSCAYSKHAVHLSFVFVIIHTLRTLQLQNLFTVALNRKRTNSSIWKFIFTVIISWFVVSVNVTFILHIIPRVFRKQDKICSLYKTRILMLNGVTYNSEKDILKLYLKLKIGPTHSAIFLTSAFIVRLLFLYVILR